MFPAGSIHSEPPQVGQDIDVDSVDVVDVVATVTRVISVKDKL